MDIIYYPDTYVGGKGGAQKEAAEIDFQELLPISQQYSFSYWRGLDNINKASMLLRMRFLSIDDKRKSLIVYFATKCSGK